jgi:4-amino-4-deoxy-L-arabinose transferase-like glycosyltransferase
VPLLLVIAMAAALRFWALGSIPPGLYHDEAFNGLDALGVLEGERPIFFEANNGREPLFIYLVALSVAALGRSPGVIRIVAAVLGTLTIPATYLLAKAMFSRRIGLLAAAITGLTLWHVNLSRIGFRAVAMPLLVALTLWQLWRGLKDGHKRHFLIGGVLYGLTFYTYLAARFTIVALGAFGLYLILAGKGKKEEGDWRQGALAFVLAALVVLAPLMAYVATRWDAFLGRVGQVSIFNPAINEGDFWDTLLRHTGRTLLMFTNRGDFIPRHNVPLRPVFDPLLSACFLLGLILCLTRFRQSAEHALVLIWLAVMLLPTILAEDAPHFLRSVGILPVAFVVPAIGLDFLWRFLEKRTAFQVQSSKLVLSLVEVFQAQIAVALVLVFGLGDTIVDYFGDHAASQDVRYNFETAAVDLAAQANRFLGTGWDGTGLGAREDAPSPGRHLYIVDRLWRDWASVRFLVPTSPNLTILGESAKLPQVSSGLGLSSRRHTETEVMLIVWPYEEYNQYLTLLPIGSPIAVQEGSLERGDLEKEARLLYITYTATTATIPSGEREARFERGLALVSHRLDAVSPQELRLSLLWRAEAEIEADYTVFVHLTRGDTILDQDDSPPARGYYPTSLWRVGDIVDDEHTLTLPEPYDPVKHKLIVGLYQLQTLDRLQVLDEAGKPISDHLALE